MKVFYNKQQSVKGNSSFSPSAGKPTRVIDGWQKLGLPVEILSFSPLHPKDVALAHSEEYVQGILDQTRTNGFGNRLKIVADSLLWTTGSFVAAARHAVTTGEAAISPTSGFHHARYGDGGGFCTFNGLVIAAQILRRDGLANRVGILDLDQHYGDGTVDIVKKLGLDYIEHYTYGGYSITPENAEAWLRSLPDIVKSFKDCDVVLFQAGADSHIDDPLGGSFTTDQMRRRDRIVFETLKNLGVPVAWNLAGGYQDPIEKVLEIHNNTAIQCVEIYEEEK